MRLYTARWLLPVSAPPVRDGAVAVDDAGRIAYAGPAAGAPPGDETPLGDAALLPNPVAFVPGPDALLAAGRRGVAYQPVSSLADAERDVSALHARIAAAGATRRVRPGLTPAPLHAVDEDTFLDLCAWAVGHDLPLAITAGASPEEIAFLRDAAGSHADALRARGVDVVRRAHSMVHLLAELGVAPVARPLLVGGALFDESDVALAAYYGCPVAYAPPGYAPPGDADAAQLAALLDAGVPVALAAPDALAAALALDLPPDAALHLATLGAARALGFDAEAGSLDAGKHADLAAFSLAPAELDAAEARGPAYALAAAAARPPLLRLVGGAPPPAGARPQQSPPA